MEIYDSLHSGCRLVVHCPLLEEYRTLLLDLCVRQRVRSTDTKTFQKGFVRKGTLEAWSRVFNQTIEGGESSKLLMDGPVLAVLQVSVL